MRASQSPFDNLTPYETLLHDKIWTNVGNLLFPYSIYRNLISADTTIDVYSKAPDSSDADFINNNYDVVLIPLANAFRPSFQKQLELWTDLINNLNIPCVVVGVGVQAGLDFYSATEFPFDDTVKKFSSAVASKSAYIGVRGELTYEYLKRLGFGSVTQIIGCPSMYMYGEYLPIPKKTKDNLKVSVNGKKSDSEDIKNFLFKDKHFSFFIPQETYELTLLYSGMFAPTDADDIYPLSIDNELFKEDKILFCVNVPSWLELLKTADFSIGSRIHGNIAAVLAGIPSFILATDSRVLELARYHNLPYMEKNKFDFSKSFKEIYEETNFSMINNGHKDRYNNFVNFLRTNGLNPVFQPNAVFDRKIEETQFYHPIHNILNVPQEEVAQRLNNYYGHLSRKINQLNKKLETLNRNYDKKQQQIDNYKKMSLEIQQTVKKYIDG